MNDYRVYSLSDLQVLHSQFPFEDSKESPTLNATMDVRSVRALVSRLHNLIRDHDSHSNIIERFDELTKILFLKELISEDSPLHSTVFARLPKESTSKFASRFRAEYTRVANEYSEIIPPTFSRLNTKDDAICECAIALDQVAFKEVGLDIKGIAYG